ncbi:MAG TPA: isochorismatase family cysteine hydrolase [Gaiella sp.]|jgi:nicotinamidase-related amidase
MVNAALLLVDVVNDFRHEDGELLLASFRSRHPALRAELERARGSMPVVYANDDWGRWDANAPGLVRSAIDEGRGGDLVATIAPHEGDRVVLKPRYSAFDSTPLEILLRQLEVEHLRLAGMATEMCVTQTAIAARELGFTVTVLPDACACVDERLERIALEYLRDVVGVHLEP